MSVFETIAANHRKAVTKVLIEHDLDYVLILNPAVGNWSQWLFENEKPGNGPPNMEKIPTVPPFNRNNGYLVPRKGEIIPFSSLVPHPTDSAQYPRLCAETYREPFSKDKIGIVNPTYLKRVMREDIFRINASIQFIDLSSVFDEIKAIKCPEEIEMLRKASALYDRAFSTLPLLLQAGRLEQSIVVELRYRLAQLGANTQDLSLLTSVQMTSAPDGGKASQIPLAYPGRRLENHDRVNICVNGYLPGGYATALGRCYTLGIASTEAREGWSIAVEAQHIAAAHAKPGATIREMEESVKTALLNSKGMQLFQTAWAYGVGNYRCEAPRNADMSTNMTLKAGMVLAIGPSVGYEGYDPWCCMDVFIITQDGAVRLSESKQTLVELGNSTILV